MLTPEELKLQRIKNLGIGMLGKKHTQETKNKMSAVAKGRTPSKQCRKAVSTSNKTRGCSEETREKMSDSKIGNKHPQWKGGVTNSTGRYFIYCPNHPNAINNHVRRSHLVAEKALGRKLNKIKKEIVHHNNGNPNDDRNINLLICSHSYHSWLHAKMNNFKIGKNLENYHIESDGVQKELF